MTVKGTTIKELWGISDEEWEKLPLIPTLKNVELQIQDWHIRKFGRSGIDLPETLKKFGEELGEFLGSLHEGDPDHIAEEAADALFVMMHIVRQFCGAGGLSEGVAKKIIEINRRLEEGEE